MRVWHNVPLQIVGPDERVIYSGERESSGKYTFAAHIDGVYKYCFGNQMSSMTPKIVMFSMEVGEAPKDHMEGDGRLSPSPPSFPFTLSLLSHFDICAIECFST